MKKPLIALLLLGLGLPVACTVEEDGPPDPLEKSGGFCDAWAENACNADVVKYCNAKSEDSCRATQGAFCREIVPTNYVSSHAQECLDFVKTAYEDSELSPDELLVVLRLAAPCDRLSKGTRTSGQSCDSSEECNTADGFDCIKKQDATQGVCAKPEITAAGDPCDSPEQVCNAGYYCNGENCVAQKKTGGSCESDYQCKPTDHCLKETADADTGTCELRADLDEACSRDADCQSGYCAIESAATEGVCASTIRLSRTEPLCENLR
jgi:hypothetical protein